MQLRIQGTHQLAFGWGSLPLLADAGQFFGRQEAALGAKIVFPTEKRRVSVIGDPPDLGFLQG